MSTTLLADGLDEAYFLASEIRLPELPPELTEEEKKEIRELLQRERRR